MQYSRAELRHRTAVQHQKRRRMMFVGVIGVIAVCILVTILVLTLGGNGNSTKVPAVIYMTYSQALKAARAANLKLRVDASQDTSKVKNINNHKVTDQSPEDGIEADKGSLLTIKLDGVPDITASPGSSETVPVPSQSQTAPQSTAPAAELVAPVAGPPLYPFTKAGSIACGRWPAGSTDYPYFGAPRDQHNASGQQRLHGAIDIYPPGGRGTPVKAMKNGTVVQVIPDFYTRADGEITCGILIDHGDFVAFYGEMTSPPALSVGQQVQQGQQIGTVGGTVQLHFELYAPGTKARTDWYGDQPAILKDPTQFMLNVLG